ncbi:glycoside hydrolase family 95-like protein [Actinophytocola sp.]|uniref:glycoside hydrolase family 95-like protein n=1 Tax=Actinophytocola sp. TaxID=1872138 RepID=UPI0025C47326|nr:hypothetical protein [Actinophytocola sp.]
MGWNSYFAIGTASEAQVKSVADHLGSSGLAKAGYKYVWIDVGWNASPPRDPSGRLVADPARFPSDHPRDGELRLGVRVAGGVLGAAARRGPGLPADPDGAAAVGRQWDVATNGTAPNLFDMYSQGSYAIFQIDANLGAPTAMLEMLLYSRPGVIELLPALPAAWSTGRVTGIGARGGFVVDLAWSDGRVTSATIRSVGGRSTEVRTGSWSRTVSLRPGRSVTVTP